MGSVARMVAAGGRQFWYPPESDDVEKRLRIMDKYGVDVQVLSQTPPILWGLGAGEAAEICRASNDSICELCERYPDRFVGLAMVSLLDVEGALEELDRAVKDLGLRGVTLRTNQNGVGAENCFY
ncbi:MAG: amidohydrolase family protein, partial [Candidatus Freyarchaeota archaeon]